MELLNDADKYIHAWTEEQLIIWREKVEQMHVVRSGALHASFKGSILSLNDGSQISMKFLRYGLYQAYGVGRGYAHGNGGDLEFLDAEYRKKHRLDKPRRVGPKWGGYETSGEPRKRRDWFSKKLFMSTMAMVEDMAHILGDTVANVICEAVADSRAALK